VPFAIRNAAADALAYIADATVSACGRIELVWYVEEQTLLSNRYHRYGNLGRRDVDARATCEPFRG
jgi:hypothetical protein